MIYLKTIFSASNEIKFIKLNLREAFKHIDKFIICEFNRTHIGKERQLIFNQYMDEFTEQEKNKIIYIGADISNLTSYSETDTEIAHNNERLMRGYFANQILLHDEDIVFSVDADEIIYDKFYSELIKKLKYPWINVISLPMYQYFYKINYLWKDIIFKSAIVCKAKYYKKEYPAQWRDNGSEYKKIVGAHFSWCLTIDEMINKIQSYAHHKDYINLCNRDILENAIKTKSYPFEPEREFNIEVLDIFKDRVYYPQSIYGSLSNFSNLIGD